MAKGGSKGRTPHPIDVRVGERIRARRLMLGLSQGELAERLGVTFQAVQKYEHAEARVTASRLYRLATALGVDCNYFFYVEGPESTLPAKITQAEAFLLRAFRQLLDLSSPVQQEIVRLIQNAARSHVQDQPQ